MAMGATTVIQTPILVDSAEYFEGNQNKVFLGYSRTDKSSKATRSIAIKAEILNVSEPPESTTANGKSHVLVAEAATDVTELPHAVNLIGTQGRQDTLLPRLYLYYSTTGGDPIYDICIDGDPIRMPVLLTAYYGLRRSEVLGLKWSAIDFTDKTISVRHKVLEDDEEKKLVGMDVMKTKSSYRTLPLIPLVEEELLRERERQEEMKQVMRRAYNREYEEYICVDAVGELIRPRYVTEHFQVILKQNGLRRIRFHDLRNSTASLLLSRGVPMKMIQDWLGHSDMGTTANIYSHIDSESKKASASVIGDALG
jgi:hypothetical protein